MIAPVWVSSKSRPWITVPLHSTASVSWTRSVLPHSVHSGVESALVTMRRIYSEVGAVRDDKIATPAVSRMCSFTASNTESGIWPASSRTVKPAICSAID